MISITVRLPYSSFRSLMRCPILFCWIPLFIFYPWFSNPVCSRLHMWFLLLLWLRFKTGKSPADLLRLASVHVRCWLPPGNFICGFFILLAASTFSVFTCAECLLLTPTPPVRGHLSLALNFGSDAGCCRCGEISTTWDTPGQQNVSTCTTDKDKG